MKIPRPFCAMFPFPLSPTERLTLPYSADWRVDLRRHLAEIVALTDVDAGATDDVVRRRRMELHLQHCEMVQVVLTLELARLATHRDRNDGIVLAVELIRTQPLQEVDGLVDARLHLGEAVVLVR